MLTSLSFTLERTSFETLEHLSRHHESITDAFDDPSLTQGSVVLSTCNRFEIYADTGAGQQQALLTRLSRVTGLDAEMLGAAADAKAGRETAEHLFAVASGLESAVVGEGEIAGQVRRAHDDARQRATLTHDLEHLFRTATRTSREVGHRTEIRSAGRSLVRLSLRMAEARVPDWQEARVLLIGTGAYAGATVTALQARGVTQLRVFSPSGRAEGYAAERGLEAVAQGELQAELKAADLVIACSRADDPVLTANLVREALDAERRRELLLIDLGLPRNIDPLVAELPGAWLLDLETISKHAPVTELSAEAEALEIVRTAAAEFSASQAEREALPALLALRTHVAGILEDELCRARKATAQLAPEAPNGSEATAEGDPLGNTSSAEIEAALRRFSGKLLHLPMTRIRTLGREGRVNDAAAALETLFGIDALPSDDGSGV